MMTEAASQPPETLLYSYRIASGDMKYIEINTREIYLREDPQRGFVLRGEIPECGASCHATLSRVFLEYAMSCRGLNDSSEVVETVTQFGDQLGQKLGAKFKTLNLDRNLQDPAPVVFEWVIASMGGQFRKESFEDRLVFTFSESPLVTTAKRYGHQRWVPAAYQGFLAFFKSTLKSVGGGWTLPSPIADDSAQSLETISLQKIGI